MIKQRKGKWIVLSEKGKELGEYRTKEEAIKRLKQIEYYKKKAKQNGKL